MTTQVNKTEQFVDLQILVNLLQTPQISEDNIATINLLIKRELIKIFDTKAPTANESIRSIV